MTSIERTAYPRFPKYRPVRDTELVKFYTPTREESILANQFCKEKNHQLNFTLLYKTFQKLGYFPEFDDIPAKIINHIKSLLSVSPDFIVGYRSDRTKRQHQQFIRELLNVSAFNKQAMEFSIRTALLASKTKNNPADIMNIVIEELIHQRYELPPYSTLDRLVRHSREQTNNNIFNQISNQLSQSIKDDTETNNHYSF